MPEKLRHPRDITRKEWGQYQWIEVKSLDGNSYYIRGARYTRPPEDGYEYEEITTMGDAEQKWRRKKTFDVEVTYKA